MFTLFNEDTTGVTEKKVFWCRRENEFWCRAVPSLMGLCLHNMDENIKSPFDKRFNGNFVEGKGKTKEEALENMAKEISSLCDLLFSI